MRTTRIITHAPHLGPKPKAPPPPKGLGDVVASVATPIARILRLPCIDPATQQLRPESECAKHKAALNAWSSGIGGQ